MHTKAYFTTLFLALVFFAKAQPVIEWQKTFGGSYYDDANSVKHTSDGGYVVAGYALSNNNGDVFGSHGNGDFWIIKLKANGAVQWKKIYGGWGIDEPYSIEQSTDGGYIVAGKTNSDNLDVVGFHGDFGGEYDGWVIKLNAAGALEWAKTYGGFEWDGFYDVAQTTDGGYILTGLSVSSDGDLTSNYGFKDVWVVKLNAAGGLEWQRNYGGSSEDIGYSVAQTVDGGFMVVGKTESDDGDVTGFQGFADVWVLKLTASGEIEWKRTYGGDSGDYGTSLLQSSDGGYLITAYSYSQNSGDVSGPPYLYSSNYWVVKLNPSGDIQWQIAMGGTGDDRAQEAVETADGNFVVIGTAKSADGDIDANKSYSKMWVVKISSTGQLIWKKSIRGSNGDKGYSIDVANDGGYILAGHAWPNENDDSGITIHGYDDYWVVKLSPDVSSPTTEPGLAGDAMQIFPNPTAEAVQLKVPMDVGAIKVTITDLQGREVLKSEVENGGILSVKSLPSGVYQVAAMADDETIYFGKLEVIK